MTNAEITRTEKYSRLALNLVVNGSSALIENERFSRHVVPPAAGVAREHLQRFNNNQNEALSSVVDEMLRSENSLSENATEFLAMYFVGPLGIFTPELLSLWKQLRFIAVAAAIYGHNLQDEMTQSQIIVCLLQHRIQRSGGSLMKKKALITGSDIIFMLSARFRPVKAAAGFITRIGSSWIYGDIEKKLSERRLQELTQQVKENFSPQEKPSLIVAELSFLIWILPIIAVNGSKVWSILDANPKRVGRLIFPEEASLVLESIYSNHPSLLLFSSAFLVLMQVLFVTYIGFKSWNSAKQVVLNRPWVLSSVALFIRSLLNLLSARNTSLAVGHVLREVNQETPYNVHRAAVGLFSIASKRYKSLRKFNPIIVPSLLIWPLCYLIWWMTIQLFKVLRAFDFEIALADPEGMLSQAFGWDRLKDALSASSATALFILLDELKKPEVVLTILGPKKVLNGLLLATKKLGGVVAAPGNSLNWLDEASPPIHIVWLLVALQQTVVTAGFWGGLLIHFEFIPIGVIALTYMTVLIGARFVLRDMKLPEPYEGKVWSEAVQSKDRLLYLLPEIDSDLRSRISHVIHLLESYDRVKSNIFRPFANIFKRGESVRGATQHPKQSNRQASSSCDTQSKSNSHISPQEDFTKSPERRDYRSYAETEDKIESGLIVKLRNFFSSSWPSNLVIGRSDEKTASGNVTEENNSRTVQRLSARQLESIQNKYAAQETQPSGNLDNTPVPNLGRKMWIGAAGLSWRSLSLGQTEADKESGLQNKKQEEVKEGKSSFECTHQDSNTNPKSEVSEIALRQSAEKDGSLFRLRKSLSVMFTTNPLKEDDLAQIDQLTSESMVEQEKEKDNFSSLQGSETNPMEEVSEIMLQQSDETDGSFTRLRKSISAMLSTKPQNADDSTQTNELADESKEEQDRPQVEGNAFVQDSHTKNQISAVVHDENSHCDCEKVGFFSNYFTSKASTKAQSQKETPLTEKDGHLYSESEKEREKLFSERNERSQSVCTDGSRPLQDGVEESESSLNLVGKMQSWFGRMRTVSPKADPEELPLDPSVDVDEKISPESKLEQISSVTSAGLEVDQGKEWRGSESLLWVRNVFRRHKDTATAEITEVSRRD